MKISSPSRNTSARKPSHLGSKIQSPSSGNSSTRFASIGRIGGFSGRFTPHGITWLHLLIAAERNVNAVLRPRGFRGRRLLVGVARSGFSGVKTDFHRYLPKANTEKAVRSWNS